MTEFFNKFKKKSVFGPFYFIFPILEAVTILPESLVLSQWSSYAELLKQPVIQVEENIQAER